MSHHEKPLTGKRIVCLVENLYEDLELWYPVIRLREAGAEVVLASPKHPAHYTGKHGLPADCDLSVDKVDVDEFDGLLIPGGYAPDLLRRCEGVLKLVRSFNDAGKLIAFVCHAGWVIASAGLCRDRRMTGFFAIKDDLVNAGAKYEDKSCVIDHNLVSARCPDDLPDFCRGIIDVLENTDEIAKVATTTTATSRR